MIVGPQVSVILQSFTGASDGQGGFADTVTDVETMKGSLKGMSKDEKVAYGKDTSTPMFVLLVEGKKADRSARTITTANKIAFGSRTFNVLFADNLFEADNIIKVDLEELSGVDY